MGEEENKEEEARIAKEKAEAEAQAQKEKEEAEAKQREEEEKALKDKEQSSDSSEVEDGTVVKEVDLKNIHFSIVKNGEGFDVKRDNEVIGTNIVSVDEAGHFIHKFCYGAKTV